MSYFNNCSICEERTRLSKLYTYSLSDAIVMKLGELFFISSAVVVLYILNILILSEFKWKKLNLSEMKLNSKTVLQLIALSVLILTLPLLTVLIAGALLYKVICSIAIKRKDKRFIKYLDSFDVFCCLEDKDTTDVEGIIQSNTIELAVDKIKNNLKHVFTNYGTDEMFYRRNEDYGFYYWRRYSFIDLAQYVEIVEDPEALSDDINQIATRGKNVNQIVSYNDEGLFKVLIMKNEDTKDQYKITLKFHHSVKDAALIEFVARLIEKSDDLHVTLQSTPSLQEYDSPGAILNMITKLCDILAHSFDDNKKKHNRSIERLKTLKWTQSDENLLGKVRYVCDLNFTDILGDALTRALRNLER